MRVQGDTLTRVGMDGPGGLDKTLGEAAPGDARAERSACPILPLKPRNHHSQGGTGNRRHLIIMARPSGPMSARIVTVPSALARGANDTLQPSMRAAVTASASAAARLATVQTATAR